MKIEDIKHLPDLEVLAHSMDEIFVPSDCPIDKILVRKAEILKTDKKTIVPIFMAYTSTESKWGWNLLTFVKEVNSSWDIATTICNHDDFEAFIKDYFKQTYNETIN